MYKAKQIKPKRYPQNKPSNRGFHVSYHVLGRNGTQYLFDWNPSTEAETMQSWDGFVGWFIDVPNPPDELQFLAYPKNKPDERGMYWCHIVNDIAHAIEHNNWEIMQWCWNDYSKENDWNGYRALIDYFIPYRLDREEHEMDVIWRSDDTILSSGKENVLLRNTRNGETDKIIIGKHAFTDICLHWLDSQGEKDKYKIMIEQIAELIDEAKGYTDDFSLLDYADLVNNIAMIVSDITYKEDDEMDTREYAQTNQKDKMKDNKILDSAWYTIRGLDNAKYIEVRHKVTNTILNINGDEFTAAARSWLELQGYDVIKREPDIAPCPNPECGGNITLNDCHVGNKQKFYYECESCGYVSPIANTPEEAIRLHNLIADKSVKINFGKDRE